MKNYISCKNFKCIHNKGFGGCTIIPSLTKNGECVFFTDKVTPKLEIKPLLSIRITKEIAEKIGLYTLALSYDNIEYNGRKVEIIE